MSSFTKQEFSRYSRHFILPEIQLEGQKKLKNAKVLVVGTGGLGSPVLLYLSAAGVGTIGLVDFDVVDESNLQRQVLFGTENLGKSKVKSAKERLEVLNPFVNFVCHEEALTSENALKIIKNYDLVIDGTDNFATRYLVNDACVLLGKPNAYGSIFRFEGQASVFNFEDGPCYRCLYPEPPPTGLVPSCAEGGVLGVLPGIIGCIQATEAIKIITGIGETLKGRFLLYDALSMEFTEMRIRKNENCVVCGTNPTIAELIDYQEFCGVLPKKDSSENLNEVSVQELKAQLESTKKPKLLDVREDYELEIAKIEGAIHIPQNEIEQRFSELNSEENLVVFCRTGVRSAKVCKILESKDFGSVKNLKGGILAWAKEIDSSIAVY